MSGDLAFTTDQDGNLVVVYHPNDERAIAWLDTLGPRDDRRAGFVYPQHPVARLAFRAMRWVAGSKGRVADWTRNWSGRWVVIDAQTGAQLPGSYPSHAAAVDAEVEWSLKQSRAPYLNG